MTRCSRTPGSEESIVPQEVQRLLCLSVFGSHTPPISYYGITLHNRIAKRRTRTAGHWPDQPAATAHREPPRAQPLCEHDTRVSTGDTDSQSLVGALHSRVTATMPAQCIQCSTRQLTQPAMGGHVHGALKRKERHGHSRPAHVQRGPTPCLLE